MTDYNPPDDTEIATSKAIKATTGRRLRDMSIAIAEGNPDAPRVDAVALSRNRVFYESIATVNTTGSTIDMTDVGLVSVAYRLQTGTGSPAEDDTRIRVSFSDDGGSTWGGWSTIESVDPDDSNIQVTYGEAGIYIDLVSGNMTRPETGVTSLSGAAGADAIRFNVDGDAASSARIVLTVMGGKDQTS